ncbi:MAG: serine/threonine protein kinase, partial [Myxococcales bacterium]|nr:serine/threonine protein kinase [Myxococcales bacterium]
MSLICPHCQRRYRPGHDRCSADDTTLVADPMVGRVLGGREIREFVGGGAMGMVFKAYYPPLDRFEAVKLMHARLAQMNRSAVDRFHREARIVANLRNPHVVQVYDTGADEDGHLFICMELIKGEPLSDVIERLGCLSPARVVRLMTQVCDALAEAHDRGVVHRDLKPDNLILETDRHGEDVLRVLDFGIAHDAEALQKTETGVQIGTPVYMAPEQVRGDHDAVNGRTDIYALGVIAYTMLTGDNPFLGRGLLDVLQKQLSFNPPRVDSVMPAVSPAFAALIAQMMAKPPAERPADMDAVRAALRALHETDE